MKAKKTSENYKKYRLKQLIGLLRYSVTLLALAGLVVWAPNQAGQFTGYIGAFILGGTKIKGLIGL